MVKHNDPRTLLKKIAVPLVHEFFRRRGELLELPWAELIANRRIHPVQGAWQGLPDCRRHQVQAILHDLLKLSDDRGMKVLTEQLRSLAPERTGEFASCGSRLNKAMWFYLNFPESFEHATLFARADSLFSSHYAVRRMGLPRTPIQVTPEVTQSLETALRDYYWSHEMRGNHCHVEHYTRSGGNEYFFAYLDDWPDTRLVFEDSGELEPKSELLAFSVVFVYCPEDGSLELVAKGDATVQYALQQAFCRAVLGINIQPADPLRPEYRLQQVLSPEFTYPTDTKDGIARVRLRRIRLTTNAHLFPVIAFELKFHPDVPRMEWLGIIHRDIEAHGLRLNQVIVQQATFQLTFFQSSLARTRTMSFTITAPSLCNLKTKLDEVKDIGERCLKRWGMIDA